MASASASPCLNPLTLTSKSTRQLPPLEKSAPELGSGATANKPGAHIVRGSSCLRQVRHPQHVAETCQGVCELCRRESIIKLEQTLRRSDPSYRARVNMKASSFTLSSMPPACKACIGLASSRSWSKDFHPNEHISTNGLSISKRASLSARLAANEMNFSHGLE